MAQVTGRMGTKLWESKEMHWHEGQQDMDPTS